MNRREEIPLFPLPNVVLFPDALLPLHIFEPRYRQMVQDACNGDRKIGMVLLKKGWENRYEENPDVFATGCMGQIVDVESLPDGRFNILLKGICRFAVGDVVQPKPYRRARVSPLEDRIDDLQDAAERTARKNLNEAAAAIAEFFVYNKMSLNRVPVDFKAPLGTVVDTLSYYLAIDPYEKQPILEEIRVGARAGMLYEKMMDLVQFKKATREGWKFADGADLN